MKIHEAESYKHRGRFFGWGSSPDSDWRVMFTIFLVVLLLSAIDAAFVFRHVKSGDFGVSERDETSIVDKDKLQAATNFYEKKRLDFETLRTTPETSPDPSI